MRCRWTVSVVVLKTRRGAPPAPVSDDVGGRGRSDGRLGTAAPGMGMTREPLASIQANVTCCGLAPTSSATSAKAGKFPSIRSERPMPPIGLHGMNTMPNFSQCSSSPSDERKRGENSF